MPLCLHKSFRRKSPWIAKRAHLHMMCVQILPWEIPLDRQAEANNTCKSFRRKSPWIAKRAHLHMLIIGACIAYFLIGCACKSFRGKSPWISKQRQTTHVLLGTHALENIRGKSPWISYLNNGPKYQIITKMPLYTPMPTQELPREIPLDS